MSNVDIRTVEPGLDRGSPASERFFREPFPQPAIEESVGITRSRPPEMGASTLKQTVAMVDRLRKLAMDSERPRPAPSIELAPQGQPSGKELIEGEEETTPDHTSDKLRTCDVVVSEVAGPPPLVTPLTPPAPPSLALRAAARVAPANPAPELVALREEKLPDGEPATGVPPVRRAREREARLRSTKVRGVALALVLAVVAGGVALEHWGQARSGRTLTSARAQ